MDGGKALKRADGIYFAEVGDEFFVTLEDRDVVACLNRGAFALLDSLEGFSDAQAVGHALAAAHGLEPESFGTAVSEVCDQAHKLGLLIDAAWSDDDSGKTPPILVDRERPLREPPEILRAWEGDELANGMFIASADGDIKVIVPNVTTGPIKTCPPKTCTVPAGLFTERTIIRTFSEDWRKAFEGYSGSGLVQFERRQRDS